jgi:hypothetical protein
MKNVRVAEHMLKYTLSPVVSQGFDTGEIVPLLNWQDGKEILRKRWVTRNSPLLAVKDLETNEEWKKAFMAYSEWRRSASLLVGPATPADSFEVVFLGTGAALPSKYRNVSATYVHTANAEGFLLDAGEGTLGQMYRKYGPRAEEVILSHKHLLLLRLTFELSAPAQSACNFHFAHSR